MMQLRKICQHPYLVAPELENHSLPENEQHRLLVQGCGKMAFLKILLPKLKERGHRVLLFSQVSPPLPINGVGLADEIVQDSS
jgi:chromodomain-helicase-DNA-binding protein 4